jgi:hypothetical protein
MPKMFVWNEIVNSSTHRRVIDGQQRMSAILDFINGKFPLLSPYEGPYSYIREGVAEAIGNRNAVRLWTGPMESISHFAEPSDHAQDPRAVRLHGCQALQNKRAGTFGHHETLPVFRNFCAELRFSTVP